jgi:tRNA(Ile)-lysidine synthase TilS/MesJ
MVDGFADSTVLAHVLTLLNKRHDYGLDLFLLSIDEGIAGYRDDSLETVKRNETQVCTSTMGLSFPAESVSRSLDYGYLIWLFEFGCSMESPWRLFHTRHSITGPWTKSSKKSGSRTTAPFVVYFAVR